MKKVPLVYIRPEAQPVLDEYLGAIEAKLLASGYSRKETDDILVDVFNELLRQCALKIKGKKDRSVDSEILRDAIREVGTPDEIISLIEEEPDKNIAAIEPMPPEDEASVLHVLPNHETKPAFELTPTDKKILWLFGILTQSLVEGLLVSYALLFFHFIFYSLFYWNQYSLSSIAKAIPFFLYFSMNIAIIKEISPQSLNGVITWIFILQIYFLIVLGILNTLQQPPNRYFNINIWTNRLFFALFLIFHVILFIKSFFGENYGFFSGDYLGIFMILVTLFITIESYYYLTKKTKQHESTDKTILKKTIAEKNNDIEEKISFILNNQIID